MFVEFNGIRKMPNTVLDFELMLRSTNVSTATMSKKLRRASNNLLEDDSRCENISCGKNKSVLRSSTERYTALVSGWDKPTRVSTLTCNQYQYTIEKSAYEENRFRKKLTKNAVFRNLLVKEQNQKVFS